MGIYIYCYLFIFAESSASQGGSLESHPSSPGKMSTTDAVAKPKAKPAISSIEVSTATVPDFQAIFQQIKDWLNREKENCKVFGILVVGETGTGKSTLINNLLITEIGKGGRISLKSQTSIIQKFTATVEGVPVVLYDTPGLGDSRGGGRDAEYLKKMKTILDSNEIQLVLYCFKLSETRMRASLIDTFVEYNKISVKWEQTIMALTFADYVPVPYKEKQKAGFQMCQFFDERVVELHQHIRSTLVEKVGVDQGIVGRIKVCPSTSDRAEPLPNGKQWFVPLWLDVLDLLSPGATARFFQMHANNIRSRPGNARGGSFCSPTVADDPDICTLVSAVSTKAGSPPRKTAVVAEQQTIPLEPEDAKKFKEIIVVKAQKAEKAGRFCTVL